MWVHKTCFELAFAGTRELHFCIKSSNKHWLYLKPCFTPDQKRCTKTRIQQHDVMLRKMSQKPSPIFTRLPDNQTIGWALTAQWLVMCEQCIIIAMCKQCTFDDCSTYMYFFQQSRKTKAFSRDRWYHHVLLVTAIAVSPLLVSESICMFISLKTKSNLVRTKSAESFWVTLCVFPYPST